MDITCPKCKTEYEFEESKITDAGVTVKCTSCNYMFKVRRRAVIETEPVTFPPASASVAPAAAPDAAKPWMIRTASGQVYTFKELTTLQQWIVERKVTRDDHISKSGETWKRLGDIAELASFFQVVDAAMAAENMGAPPPPAAGAYQRPPSHQHARRPSRATPPPTPAQSFVDEAPRSPMPLDEPAFAGASARFQAVGPSAAWEEGGGRLSGRHASVELADELPRRGGGKLVGIVLVALLLLGGAIAAVLFKDRLKGLFGGGDADEAFQSGRKLFLLDDEDSLSQADQQLARAPQSSALAQAARAEVFTTWAQHLREEAELLERGARLAEMGAKVSGELDARGMRLKATTLKEEADKKLGQAELYAKKALDLAPEKGEVKRAMADYLRLLGKNNRDVLPFLTDARKKLPDDPEAIYVEAAFWTSQGNLPRAEEMLKDALARTKARFGQTLLRAAGHLALLQLRGARLADARAQADAILQASPKHRLARVLLEVLEAEEKSGTKPAPTASPDGGPTVAKPGGGEPKPGGGEPRPGGGEPKPGGGEPRPGGGEPRPGGGEPKPGYPKAGGGEPKPGHPKAGGGEPAGGGTYESLVKEGNALSEKGRAMQAFKLFERALKLKPTGVEALTGVGYCHLDGERFAQAIAYFKKAMTIMPTSGEALIGMAEAYKVQGNNAKALDYYRAYLQAQPGGPKAGIARRNVSDLERKVGTPSPDPKPEPKTEPKPEPKVDPKPDPAPTPSETKITP